MWGFLGPPRGFVWLQYPLGLRGLRCDFMKSVDLNLNNVELYAWLWFSKNVQTSAWKMWTFRLYLIVIFWKSVDLILENVDLYAWLYKKCGPQHEICGHLWVIFWKMWTSKICGSLHLIFWKVWTSTWKMWTYLGDVLKNGDLNLKNFDLYADFLENVDLDLKNVDLYTWFSEKVRTLTKNEDIYAWFS